MSGIGVGMGPISREPISREPISRGPISRGTVLKEPAAGRKPVGGGFTMDEIPEGVWGGVAGLLFGIVPTTLFLFLSKFGPLATSSVTFKNTMFMWLFFAAVSSAPWAVGGTDYLKGRLAEWNVSERWIDREGMAQMVHMLAFLVLAVGVVPVLSKFLLSRPVTYLAASVYACILISCFAGFLSITSGNESGS